MPGQPQVLGTLYTKLIWALCCDAGSDGVALSSWDLCSRCFGCEKNWLKGFVGDLTVEVKMVVFGLWIETLRPSPYNHYVFKFYDAFIIGQRTLFAGHA